MWYRYEVKNKTLKSLIIFLVLIAVLVIFIPYSVTLYQKILEQKAQTDALNKISNDQLAAIKAAKAKEKAEADAKEKIYLTGKFDQSTSSLFTVVPQKYNVSGYKMYLRKETLAAFQDMAEAARKDGVNLNIASATRNFDYQKGLWDSKWTGKMLESGENLAKTIPDSLQRFQKILEYSAVPGTSRHHWGTDIDLNAATPEYFETAEGEKVYDWLTENAATYGFCQPYTAKDESRLTGYNEEKWHWSYLPLSKTFTEEYKSLVTSDDISGFDGDENVSKMDLIDDYVLGINKECL